MNDGYQLVTAEIVMINFSTYVVEILNSDHSLKRRMKVSRQSVWRLVKMWAKTPGEWRCLEWQDHECIGKFRHRRKKLLQQTMKLSEYVQQEHIRRSYE